MAVANAVAAALHRQDPTAETRIEDVLRNCRQFPLTRFPDMYGPLVNHLPDLWTALWSASDFTPTVDLISRAGWPLVSGHLHALARGYRPDVLVPVHPLLVRPAVRLARREGRMKVACIVTDLVRLHSFWLDPEVDLYLLPSDEAARAARAAGIPPDRYIVCGQPIPTAVPSTLTPAQAKCSLGLNADRPLVLVTGGGAGAGPLAAVSEALVRTLDPSVQTAVICGRNEALRRKLERREKLTRVLGYVSDMPQWLRATDVLVTKAGPNALAEAVAEGLPTVIMAALPGQETDNVHYYCRRGAAVWAPTPDQVCSQVVRILRDGEWAGRLSARAKAVARPDAAAVVAADLSRLASAVPVSQERLGVRTLP